MADLFQLVTQTPIDELPGDPVHCPLCGSDDIFIKSTMTTAVGWSGRGPNPNHRHTDCRCKKCREPFFRECEGNNVWYTAGHQRKLAPTVLRGMPSCFERYEYTCSKCGGEVLRRYTQLDGKSDVTSLNSYHDEDGTWRLGYRIFYECQQCGLSAETERDYWRPGVNSAIE